MKIPIGGLSLTVANPLHGGRQGVPRAGGFGEGLQALGESVGRIERKEEAEAKAAEIEANRVLSISAQAQAKNSLADLHDDLVTGLQDGRYDKTALPDLHTERSNKLIEDAVGKVSLEHQELVRASLLDDVGRSRREIRHAVDARNRQDIASGINTYMESMQRYASRGEDQRQEAMRNIDTFLQSAGPQAGMKPEEISKTIQSFKENVTLNWLDSAISQNQANSKALEKIAADIAADKFPELDPAKRNFLEAKIQRNQQHILAKAEAAERRNMANLDRMQNRLNRYIENGLEIPASELSAFEKASRGTVFEGATKQIIAEQKSMAELLRMSPAEIDAKIKALENSYGKTPTLEQASHLNKLRKFADNSIKQLNNSPLEYAVQRNGAVIEPLDLANAGSWAENLAARTGVLKEQEKRTGAAPKGLFPQEAHALTSMLREARPDQQRTILGSLYDGFGDMRVFKATMAQIAPDNPVMANAGIFAARGLQSTKDRYVADMILRGNDLLRQDTKVDGKPSGGKLIPMPEDKEMMRVFSGYAEEAYAGKEQAMNVAFQTAKAIYAAKASEEGDFAGNLVSKRWRESMELATGRIDSYRGRNIVLPYGMDYGHFKDGVKARITTLATAGKFAPGTMVNNLSSLPLENVGDGRYGFRVGDGLLVGKDGAPVVIDFNEAGK